MTAFFFFLIKAKHKLLKFYAFCKNKKQKLFNAAYFCQETKRRFYPKKVDKLGKWKHRKKEIDELC